MAGCALRPPPVPPQSPFTLTVVIALGLGIGAMTAIFSAVYALLLRELSYADASRLIYVSLRDPASNSDMILSPDFVAARSSTMSFEQFAGYVSWTQNLTGAGGPLRVARASITANLLPMLGVLPRLGRIFPTTRTAPEGRPSSLSAITDGRRSFMSIRQWSASLSRWMANSRR